MNLKEASLLCEKAWSQYAEKSQINRDDVFYFQFMYALVDFSKNDIK